MDKFTKHIISVVLSLFLLIYVAYQCFSIFYSPIKTESVLSYSDYDKVETQGFAVRNETIIKTDANGYLSYTIENGSRVSKDGKIADVYPSETDSRAQKQWDNLEYNIVLLQEIQSQGDSNRVNLDVIDKQIRQTIRDMTANVNSARIAGMDSWQSELLALMNKRQIAIGNDEDFTSKINQLTEQKKKLESSYSKAVSSVSSPAAGYFISTIDGFENRISTEKVKELSVDDLNSVMKEQPTVDKASCIGKVVENYQWYLACTVPAVSAGSLRQGASFDILLPFVSDDAIPAEVVAANRDKDGNVAVVFECSYMSSALSSVRRDSVIIRLERYEGLRVPSNCVITNADGAQGVYTAVGDTCEFRKIEILHSEPDYVICKENDQAGYLKVYDDIITEGKGLYDGKTVR